ncbi:hypothetical protein FYK55_20410 [Roseiconus nitratireducens]|uniref:Uncharacterized protein n=1 Tax=Roseiconus nitratireducens TaxID=2605748 RepID=A0A5M6CZT1_9BACT|nr:hypothetical protein [Roseiconus nitratireducens]KAA5540748.1 hypothetical protein FYK55_20410 [Roseiconus nitratireducens]
MTDSPNPYRPIGDHRERPSDSSDAPADTAPSGQESDSTDVIWLLVLLIGLVSFGLSVHLWGAVTESW